MEHRHLRNFLAVADELHFGRAATRVGIAQPALIQQIRRLEREVGAELFHRSTREVRLSAAGEAMRPFARLALQNAEQGSIAAIRASRGETGHLTVGFIESASGSLIPNTVSRFRASSPNVSLTLRELGVEVQVEALRSGQLEVGFVRPPVDPTDLPVETIVEEGFLVAVPAAGPLARKKRISAKGLVGQPLIALSREVVPGLYDQVIAHLALHGWSGSPEQEATSIQAVLGLVAADLGVAILPASVRTLSREGVVFLPLTGSPRSSTVMAYRRDDRSPVLAAFLAAARAAATTA